VLLAVLASKLRSKHICLYVDAVYALESAVCMNCEHRSASMHSQVHHVIDAFSQPALLTLLFLICIHLLCTAHVCMLQVSDQIYRIFHRTAPVVQAVSCDEAFMELPAGTDAM
jgi:nucleotidyltransferase/DNA polymerase involved in DNA repair